MRSPPPPPLAERVRRLEAAFVHIQHTRMAGVPVLHAGLRVQALGFEPLADEPVALGVLLTPWFMNLLRLPLADDAAVLPVGDKAERDLGPHRFTFIGAQEDALGGDGRYEACSLFSPMQEFQDHAAALATAREVLALLRPAPQPLPPAAKALDGAVQPARRGFLFGRSALPR